MSPEVAALIVVVCWTAVVGGALGVFVSALVEVRARRPTLPRARVVRSQLNHAARSHVNDAAVVVLVCLALACALAPWLGVALWLTL